MTKGSASSIIPTLRYKDAAAAIEWLCNVLGCSRHAVYAGAEGRIEHAELVLCNGMIMLGSAREDEYGRGFKSPEELGGVETRSTYVMTADVDVVWARAQTAGAKVVRAMQETSYGSREFTIKDPEGNSWSVGTYDPWTSHG